MALTEMVIMRGVDYQDACDAVREKTGGTGVIKAGDMGTQIRAVEAASELADELATQDDLIAQIMAALESKIG